MRRNMKRDGRKETGRKREKYYRGRKKNIIERGDANNGMRRETEQQRAREKQNKREKMRGKLTQRNTEAGGKETQIMGKKREKL